jgi:hypothetical protein
MRFNVVRSSVALVALSLCAPLPAGGSELLFYQPVDNQSAYGPSSQSPSGSINAEVADDFTVTGDIDRVIAYGFKSGTVTDFRGVYVRFYAVASDGAPGAPLAEYFVAAGDSRLVNGLDAGLGYLDITLSPVFSATGRHYVSVQPVVDLAWYRWSANTGAPRGSRFFFRNLAAGQVAWQQGDAQPYPNENADVAFALYGVTTGPGQITSLSAATLPRSGYLEILGSNLGGSGIVSIGNVAAPVAAWSSTRIVAYVPEAAPIGTVNVQVTTAGGTTNTVPLSVTTRTADGRVSWRLRMEGAYSVVRPARGPDGTIYAIDVGFHLYAVAPDGGLKWVKRGAGNKGLAVGADGTIYTGSESDIKAYAPDGTLKWTFVQNPRAFILLGIGVGGDGNIYGVATEGLGVFSLTPQGTLRWTNPEGYSRPIVDYAELAFGPNGSFQQLYFTANDHTRAVRLDNGASVFTISRIGQPVVSPLDGTVHARANALLPSGQLFWSFVFPISGLPVSVPDVASDGTHYVTYRMFELYALHPNGAEKWHVTLPSYVGQPNVDPGNALVVLGSDNTLNDPGFVQAISTSTQKEAWRVDLPAEDTNIFNTVTGLYGFNQFVDTPAVFSSDGRTVYLVTAVATGGMTTDRSFLYAIDSSGTGSTPPPAITNVMRATNITLSARERNGAVTASAAVTIATSTGTAVSGALVQATWTLPSGATQTTSAKTDNKGTAKFAASGGRGTYTFAVTDVAKTDYTFDRSGSVLSKTITK